MLVRALAYGASPLNRRLCKWSIERRTLELRGRDQTLDAWVAGAPIRELAAPLA